MLSQWISRGKRSDLFARNVLSGGAFTQKRKKGIEEGVAGDLMSAHPDSVEFARALNVECKHYKDLGIFPLFFDLKGKSFLGSVVQKCELETKQSGKTWMLVARQNMKPIIVGLQSDFARAIIWRDRPALCHSIRTANYSVTFFLFEDFLAKVRPAQLTKIAGHFPMTPGPDERHRKGLWERNITISGV